MRPGSSGQTKTYVNASWANDAEWNCRSTTGFIIIYGDAVTTATSTVQRRVRLSSRTADSVALAEAPKTIVWQHGLAFELQIEKF